ncbi:MAG TPA: IMCp domain-containing protein [Candidatus Glassbacteria bacterium]|nr:IMCp domain-containing protein [Candidatus Glassbacteria bacterium]
MNKKFLPWFLLFCAIGLSGTAAYYSVIGLSIIFSTVAIPVIIMGSFLEISKLAIATYLHDKWKETYGLLKIYLTIALVTLSLLTSIGIYGLLSTGFQQNIAGLEINNKKIENIEVKKGRFEEIKVDYQKEKEGLDKDITNLRNALSTNTTTQSVDRTTGQVITRANGGNRKAFETQLKIAQENRDVVSKKIESLNDSITSLDLEVLDLASTEIESGELGAIKYLSEITGWDIKKTANFFILALIFVFDPLAIALVISTNQAFKIVRKKDETEESVIQTETVEKIVEVPVDRIVEVEVPVDRIVEVEVPVDRIVEVVKEVPVDRLVEVIREVPVEVEVPVEIPFKYYVNDNGQIFDDQGNKVDEDIFNKKLEEIEKRVLSYKK